MFSRTHTSAMVPVQGRRFTFLCISMGIGILMIGALLAQLFLVSHTPKASARDGGSVPYGLNVDYNEQSIVDMIQNIPRFEQVGSTPLTANSEGWPTSDFSYILDNRYIFAWVPDAVNIDPQKVSTDISGTYKLSFTGQATLTATDGGDPAHGGSTVTNQSYDAATNTTVADVIIPNPSGGVILALEFTATKRNPADSVGTGVTNVKMIRPGYESRPDQVFTDLWLNSINNYQWQALRFMGATGTNDYANPATDGQPNNELYPYRLTWENRRVPNEGPLQSMVRPGVHGVPWEYVVLAAQQTNRDIWINIPVNASDDYVTQLADLLKNGNEFTGNQGIPGDLNVYVEYSNEMWHYGFWQGNWNYQAGKDEVAAGNSNLNYDGVNNDDTWRFRRMAKRTIEIGNQFKQTFSDNGTRVRPVINNAFLDRNVDMLTYVQDNYGTVNNVLYGISQTGYYSSEDKSSVQAILDGEKADSDKDKASYQQSRQIADQFGIHSLVYEGGQDEQGNKSATDPDPNLANQIASARDPGQQEVLVHDLNNWFSSGGELYMQFAHVGRYSTYGMWGLTEDLSNLQTGKWKGAEQVMSNSAWAKSSEQSSHSVVTTTHFQAYLVDTVVTRRNHFV